MGVETELEQKLKIAVSALEFLASEGAAYESGVAIAALKEIQSIVESSE